MSKRLNAFLGLPTVHTVKYFAANRRKVAAADFERHAREVFADALRRNASAMIPSHFGGPYLRGESDDYWLQLFVSYDCTALRRWFITASLRRALARHGIELIAKEVFY